MEGQTQTPAQEGGRTVKINNPFREHSVPRSSSNQPGSSLTVATSLAQVFRFKSIVSLPFLSHFFSVAFKSIKTHQRKQPSSGDRSIAQNSAYNRIKTQMYGCAVNLKPSFLCIPLFTLSRPQQILSWVWLNHGGARGRNINKLFHFISQPKAVWKMINFLFAGAAIAGVLVPSNRTCFNARSSSARRMAERSRTVRRVAPPGKNGH